MEKPRTATSEPAHHHEEFSLPLFTLVMLGTLAVLFLALRLLSPSVWDAQFLPSFWKLGAAFLLISLVNCFVEYFFHRYVLHTPLIPLVSRLYRQHTLHHGLTRIARKRGTDGRGFLFIENKFPIVEPEQGEASFFPWYSMAIFALLLSPLLAGLHFLFPSFPWFLGGFIALAVSLSLYEVLHAINHWPFEQWAPLIGHPRWGRFWQPLYAFHLRHHAVTDCNESISGFFGLPLADWTFGTCVLPQTIYADGEEWTPDKFLSPKPCAPIKYLDKWADAVVQRRRQAALRQENEDKPTQTRGETIALWVTHGLGLAISVSALTLLIVFSSLKGDAWHVVSFTVFGLSLLGLYTVSTAYNANKTERTRALFKKLDHAALFLLIAGTYTPFLLTSLRGPWGWTLFGVIWGLCGAAAVFQMLSKQGHKKISKLAYLLLGWVGVVAIGPFVEAIPRGGLWLLFAGGVCYSAGLLFYRWQRVRYHQVFWHTFVLSGSTCHLLAVLLFLLPKASS